MHRQLPQELIPRASAGKVPDDLARPKQRLGVGRPTNDSERVEELHNLSVLDSLPDPRYEDITRLVTTIFNVPIAAITLVDQDRLYFKSLQGLQYTNRQMDRNDACFCSWAVAQKDSEMLVVENAAEDARCVANSLEPFGWSIFCVVVSFCCLLTDFGTFDTYHRGGRRFADYEIVARKDRPIRFYAGAPLVAAEGHKIGTL